MKILRLLRFSSPSSQHTGRKKKKEVTILVTQLQKTMFPLGTYDLRTARSVEVSPNSDTCIYFVPFLLEIVQTVTHELSKHLCWFWTTKSIPLMQARKLEHKNGHFLSFIRGLREQASKQASK